MEIKRDLYLKKLIDRQHNGMIKVITGMRRCGKSGSLTNPAKLVYTFKSVKNVTIAPETVKSYLEYMCDSFIVEKAMRYDVKGRKYIDTPYKYYFTDTGLRNARINFRQDEKPHLMENVIFKELLIRGFNVDVGVVPVVNIGEDGKP